MSLFCSHSYTIIGLTCLHCVSSHQTDDDHIISLHVILFCSCIRPRLPSCHILFLFFSLLNSIEVYPGLDPRQNEFRFSSASAKYVYSTTQQFLSHLPDFDIQHKVEIFLQVIKFVLRKQGANAYLLHHRPLKPVSGAACRCLEDVWKHSTLIRAVQPHV